MKDFYLERMEKVSMISFIRVAKRLIIVCAVSLNVGAEAQSLARACMMKIGHCGESLSLQFNSQEETQDEDEAALARDRQRVAHAISRLTNRDPLVRQGAAEELSRLSTVGERRRMIEGYRLQERNERVRLALAYALYRAGKREALINVVRELGTPRRNQAQSYLLQLDNPEPLYVFLQRVSVPTKVALLQVLAQTGDAQTLEMISPLAASIDPQVAQAARSAVSEIRQRLASAPPSATRPRQVGGNTTTP